MSDRDTNKVAEDRQGFDAEPLVGLRSDELLFELHEIGPDEELDEADLAGIADIEAGRVVSNEAVIRWIESWGTENELPRPKCGE